MALKLDSNSARRQRRQRRQRNIIGLVIAVVFLLVGALIVYRWVRLGPEAVVGRHGLSQRNNLAKMPTTQLQVGETTLQVWIADSPRERELGLMRVTAEEMSDKQGMLFMFHSDQTGGFWMKNTLIPLDIAYIRADGTIVDIQQMEPQSIVQHTPSRPYRYALEVKAGILAAAGVREGDVIHIPPAARPE